MATRAEALAYNEANGVADVKTYKEVTGKSFYEAKEEKSAVDKGIRAVGQIPLEIAGLANMTAGLVEAFLNPAFTLGESVYEYINTNDEEYVKKIKTQLAQENALLEDGKPVKLSQITKIKELETQLDGRTFGNITKEVADKYDKEAYFHPGTYFGDEAKASWKYMQDKLGHEYDWEEFQRELHEETMTGNFAEGLTSIIQNIAKKGEALGVPKEVSGAILEIGMFYALPKGFKIAGVASRRAGLTGTAERLTFLSDKHKMDRQIKTLQKEGDVKAASALKKVDELNVYNPITLNKSGQRSLNWKQESGMLKDMFKEIEAEGKNLKSAKSQEVWHDAMLQLARNQNSTMTVLAMKAHQASQGKLIKAYGKDGIEASLTRITDAINNPKLVKKLPKVERQIYKEDFLPLRKFNQQAVLTLQKQTLDKKLEGKNKRAELGIFDNELIDIQVPHHAKLKERVKESYTDRLLTALIGSRQLRTEIAQGANARMPFQNEVNPGSNRNLRSAQKNQVYEIIQRAVPKDLAGMLDNFNRNKVINRGSQVIQKAFERDKPSVLYPQGRTNFAKPIIDKKTGKQKNLKKEVVDKSTGEVTLQNVMGERIAYKEIQRFTDMLEFIGVFDNSKGSAFNFQKAANAHYDITVNKLTYTKLKLRSDMWAVANRKVNKVYAGKKTGKAYQREVEILKKEQDAIGKKTDQLDYWYKGKYDVETGKFGGVTGKQFFEATIEQANKIADGKLVKSDYKGPGRVRNMTENIIAVTKYKDKKAGSINQMRVDDAGAIQFLKNNNLTSSMNRGKKSIIGTELKTTPTKYGKVVTNKDGISTFQTIKGITKSINKKGDKVFKDKKGKIVKDIVERAGVKTQARIVSASPARLNKELKLGTKESGPKYLVDPILVEGLKMVQNSQKLRDAKLVDNIDKSAYSMNKVDKDVTNQKDLKEIKRDKYGRVDKKYLDEEGNPVPQTVEKVSPAVDFQKMGIEELTGVRLDKRSAEIFEDIFTWREPTKITNVSNAIVRNMLINPFPHIHNEFVHLVGTSGIQSMVVPKEFKAMYGKNGYLAKATDDVLNSTGLYLEAKKHGGPMMSTNVVTENWMNAFLESTQKMVLPDNMIKHYAQTLGMKPFELYGNIATNLSRKGMWQIRDIFYTALIRQKLTKYDWAHTPENIAKAAKIVDMHMPTYKLPPRVGEKVLGPRFSRDLSRVLQNPNFIIFARYKHGMVSSGMNTVRDMAAILDMPMMKAGKPLSTIREFLDAEGVRNGRSIDQQIKDGVESALALTVGMTAIYGLLDAVFAEVVGTGHDAHIRRGGILHLMHTTKEVIKGNKNNYALFGNLVTINPALMTGAELFMNTTFYNGQDIYDLQEPVSVTMQKVLARLAKSAPMYSQFTTVTQEGPINWRQLGLRQVDVTEKSPLRLRADRKQKEKKENTRRKDAGTRLRESR